MPARRARPTRTEVGRAPPPEPPPPEPVTETGPPPPPGPELNRESPWSAFDERRVASERFFTRAHFPIPALDPRTWRLTLAGEIDWPGRIGLVELDSRPQRSVVAVLECAGNGRRRFGRVVDGEVPWGEAAVGAAEWTGVPLRELLRDAGVRSTAAEVLFEGADGAAAGFERPIEHYCRSLPIDVALGSPDLLIATSMNGVPLEPDHGAPARLIVPDWYAMASVKWLSRIEVLDHPFEGRFQTEKYVYRHRELGEGAPVPVTRLRVKSLIVSPEESARITAGQPTIVRGRAWSGAGAIAKVEVDVGGGWETARLVPGSGPHDWTSWSWIWVPKRTGLVEIAARASDAPGYVQPERPELNDFQYGQNAVHRVRVQVLE